MVFSWLGTCYALFGFTLPRGSDGLLRDGIYDLGPALVGGSDQIPMILVEPGVQVFTLDCTSGLLRRPDGGFSSGGTAKRICSFESEGR